MKKSLSLKCFGYHLPSSTPAKFSNVFSRQRRTTLSLTGLCNLTLAGFLSHDPGENHSGSVRRYSSQMHRHSPTHLYDVLGVTPRATQAQIKSAYFKLSKTYHPDLNKSDTAAGKFSQIAEAYSVLGNVRSRRLYDRGIYNPNRSHSSYAAEDFEDDAEPTFGQQEGFRERSRRPPTGRSPIYNFDEFYRAHYNETQRRVEKERQAYYEQLRQLEEDRRKKAAHLYVMILLTTIIAAVLVSQSDDDPRRSRASAGRNIEERKS